MSYADAPPAWRRGVDALNPDAPRIAGVLAIAAAGALTFAWQGPGPKPLGTDGDAPEYLIRLPLPASEPMQMEELAELTQDNDALADIAIEQGLANEATIARRRNSDAFDSAFSDLAPRPAAPQLAPGDFLSVDYDLAQLEAAPEKYDRSDGSLTVQKPLFVDGVNSGAATIRIEEGAQILIATSSVARALGDRANALPRRISTVLAQGSGFIPFYELRGAGITVEYDAARDRVSMSMPAERGG